MDLDKLIACFDHYLSLEGKPITRATGKMRRDSGACQVTNSMGTRALIGRQLSIAGDGHPRRRRGRHGEWRRV